MFPPDAAAVNSAPPPSASAPLSETVSAPRGKCGWAWLGGAQDEVQAGIPSQINVPPWTVPLFSCSQAGRALLIKKVSHVLHLPSTGRPWAVWGHGLEVLLFTHR